MNTLIRPVILCGGSGTRLWPLSRRLEPKQFQKLTGDLSLFQETLRRFHVEDFGAPLILANKDQEPMVRLELAELGLKGEDAFLVIEPAMRSTAPAIAAAAEALLSKNPDAIMLVAPSDHSIGRPDLFIEAVRNALPFVQNGGIALFGITPTSPETGFGYIRSAAPRAGSVQMVEAFIEKPDRAVAASMIADGHHTWNSGIFLFRAATILSELAAFAPSVLAASRTAFHTAQLMTDGIRLSAAFLESPEISIDHAVMEFSLRLGVIPVAPQWSDLGSFEALWQVSELDADQNSVRGKAILRDVRRSYVRAGKRLVSVVGLSNIVVIDTEDAILIASRAHSQDVKFIAQRLANECHKAAERHAVIRQAAGSSEVLSDEPECRVDRISVHEGGSFLIANDLAVSSRRLVVTSGSVEVVSDEGTGELLEGQSAVWFGGNEITLRNTNPGRASVMACSFAEIANQAATSTTSVAQITRNAR